MKRFLLGLATVATVGFSNLNATTGPKAIFAYGVGVKVNGQEYTETVLNKYFSEYNHEGAGISQVLMEGYPHNTAPSVFIGSSLGHVYKEVSVYSNGYKFGTIFYYDHYNIRNGYFETSYYSMTNETSGQTPPPYIQ